MDLNIVFRNMESTEAIKSYLEKKVKKLERIFKGKNFEVKAILSTEKYRQSAEIIINIDGIVIKGIETSEDMYSAIDLVMDKITRQAKKHREKIKEKKHSHIEEVETKKFEEEELKEKRIIKVDNYLPKPLSVEEAALQLESSEYEFLVFRNSTNNKINVIYKRKDGDYGWIDPE